MPIIEHIDLHSTAAGADKVYHLAIDEQQGAGGSHFTVRFAYGRRGAALTFGTKAIQVNYQRALSVYQKQLTVQFSKGYVSRPGVSGNVFGAEGAATAMPATANGITAPKPQSGFLPQLLNVITEEQLEFYLTSDEWGAQEKMDGRNLSVETGPALPPRAINRKGQAVPMMRELEVDMNINMDAYLINGEAIGSKLHAFDLLQLNKENLREQSYLDRYIALSNYIGRAGFTNIVLVPLFTTTEGKRKLYERVKKDSGEGLCFKRLAAPFTEGRPNSGGDQLKFKFWAQETFIVGGHNPTKRSVQLFACDGGFNRDVGNVTIPPNHEMPRTFSYVEVRYLYYYPGGSLFQPIYCGPREDAERADCDIRKLKVKQGPPEEE